MTKPSRDEVLKVAGECGLFLSVDPCVVGQIIERFAAAMYAKGHAAGAADMKELAKAACVEVREAGDSYTPNEDNHEDGHTDGCNNCEWAIDDIPITPTNTEGEQG